jgi:hypothetical protein
MRNGTPSGNRSYITPKNSGMANRDETRLEHLVAAQNAQHAEAIKVDGVPIILWKAVKSSSLLCTCVNKSTPASTLPYLDDGRPRDPNQATDTMLGAYANIGFDEINHTSVDYADPSESRTISAKTRIESFTDDAVIPNHSEYQLIIDDETYLEEDYPDGLMDDADLNAHVDETMAEPDVGGNFDNRLVQGNAFASSDEVKCGVCYGTSYANGRFNYRGQRVVLDVTHKQLGFVSHSGIENPSRPVGVAFPSGGAVVWETMLPMYFKDILRVQCWNNTDPISNAGLTWETLTGALTGNASNLSRLNGVGGTTRLTYTAPAGTTITHVEIIYQLGDDLLAQIPQITVPYEHEYVDYNVNIQIEVGADANIEAGDVLCDKKHGRAWRVTEVTQKATSYGRGFGIVAGCRSVFKFEIYGQMNIYRQQDQATIPYGGRNERLQGGNASLNLPFGDVR